MGFWCPHKRRKFGHRDVQRTDEPVIGRRQSFISQGERPRKNQSCWHLDLEHLVIDCEKMHFYCASHPVCQFGYVSPSKLWVFSSSGDPLAHLDLFREEAESAIWRSFISVVAAKSVRGGEQGCWFSRLAEQGRNLPPTLVSPPYFCPSSKHINSLFCFLFCFCLHFFFPFINS